MVLLMLSDYAAPAETGIRYLQLQLISVITETVDSAGIAAVAFKEGFTAILDYVAFARGIERF